VVNVKNSNFVDLTHGDGMMHHNEEEDEEE
jgi:hypothetical protein